MSVLPSTKHAHLCRRPVFRVFCPDRQKPHFIAEPGGDASCPRLKLLPGPLEAMVWMPKLSGWERFPRHVVFPVRCGQNDCPGPGELEQHPLEGREPGRIEVFYNLNNGGGVKAFQPLVPVHERSVDQLEPVRLHCRQAVNLEPALGHFQGADRDIQAHDLIKLSVLEQFSDQLAFTTPKVQNSFGPTCSQRSHDGSEPLLIEAEGLFQNLLGFLFRPVVFFGFCGFLFLNEAGQRQSVETRLELQVTPGDLFLLGVVGKPAFALGKQFLHFVVANPVMLPVVENGNQDVKVRQQVSQSGRFPNGHRKVRAVSPLRKPLVQRGMDAFDFVSEWLENVTEKTLATTHRQHVDPGRKRYRCCRQFGPVFTATLERRAEYLANRHAHEGRGGVGPVVDVLRQQEALVGMSATDQAHRVHVEQQAGRTPLGTDFRVIDVDLAEAQVK